MQLKHLPGAVIVAVVAFLSTVMIGIVMLVAGPFVCSYLSIKQSKWMREEYGAWWWVEYLKV